MAKYCKFELKTAQSETTIALWSLFVDMEIREECSYTLNFSPCKDTFFRTQPQ